MRKPREGLTEQIVGDAINRVQHLERDTLDRRRQALGGLVQQRELLENRIDDLRMFERGTAAGSSRTWKGCWATCGHRIRRARNRPAPPGWRSLAIRRPRNPGVIPRTVMRPCRRACHERVGVQALRLP